MKAELERILNEAILKCSCDRLSQCTKLGVYNIMLLVGFHSMNSVWRGEGSAPRYLYLKVTIFLRVLIFDIPADGLKNAKFCTCLY